MKQKDILYISISLFVLIFAWVVFSVLHNFMNTTISVPTEQKIAPISPNFDLQAIKKIKSRETIEPLYELKAAAQPSPVIASETEQSLSQGTSETAINQPEPISESFSSSDAARIFLEGFR